MNPTQQLPDIWDKLTPEETRELCNRARVGEMLSNLPWPRLAEWAQVALCEAWAKGGE